jgi:CTP:molybdopterin cytidylyltransferase MocA
MGRPKAALPITHRADTFVARLIRTCLEARVPDIVVVTGAHDEAVRAAIGPLHRPVRVVQNADWRHGQLSSLLTALRQPPAGELEAILMTLVDVPLTSVDTYVRVLRAWRSTRAPIVRPARGEVHGHPVIFDRCVFHQLEAADLALGAKVVVRANKDHIVNVPVDDPGAFVDLDTAEDYEAMRASWR